MPKTKAIVLLSGGLDSATTLAIANSRNFACCALSFRYGQRHSIELDSARKIARSMKKVKKFMGGLGAVVPPGQAHTRPMGASVHYSGTLPMSVESKPHTLTPNCRSREFGNLYFVDGTSFPFLPAKNLTFTLMANAARVADKEF